MDSGRQFEQYMAQVGKTAAAKVASSLANRQHSFNARLGVIREAKATGEPRTPEWFEGIQKKVKANDREMDTAHAVINDKPLKDWTGDGISGDAITKAKNNEQPRLIGQKED